MLKTQDITQIATDRPDLYAFRISGKISDDAMEDMAEYMNAAFDAHADKIDMLMIFDLFEGTEFGAGWDWDVIKSRIKSITHVNRYVAVGAPDGAEQMIGFMNKILPIHAETYDDEAEAWLSLRARAVAARREKGPPSQAALLEMFRRLCRLGQPTNLAVCTARGCPSWRRSKLFRHLSPIPFLTLDHLLFIC